MGDFKEGDRVILTQAMGEPSPTIPLQGSEYECVGTTIKAGETFARVLWDNGHESSFFVYKLQLYKESISKDDPNRIFLHKKRNNMSKSGRCNVDGHDTDGYWV